MGWRVLTEQFFPNIFFTQCFKIFRGELIRKKTLSDFVCLFHLRKAPLEYNHALGSVNLLFASIRPHTQWHSAENFLRRIFSPPPVEAAQNTPSSSYIASAPTDCPLLCPCLFYSPFHGRLTLVSWATNSYSSLVAPKCKITRWT